MDTKEIVRLYTEEMWTLRMIADKFNTNHHLIKRILVRNNIAITQKGRKRKPFTDEHRKKISDSRKRLIANGFQVYNKGKKTINMKNGKKLLSKNMAAHLRFDVSIEWLSKFDDIEKMKCLNKAITKRGDRWDVTTDWYIAYIEKFYYDDQFNLVYDRWRNSQSDKYLYPSLDHIVPKSNGGTNDINNLQFLSWFENRAKNNMTQSEWDKVKLNIQRYFI